MNKKYLKKFLRDHVWWICILVFLIFVFYEEILDFLF